MKYNDDYNNIDNQTGNYDYGYEDGGRETANTGSPQPNPELLNNAAYTQQKAASPANPQNQKNSTLGVWALILSILGCTFFIGAILAIIDITKKDGRKKTLSIIALCFAGLWIITIMTGRFRRSSRLDNNKSEVVRSDDGASGSEAVDMEANETSGASDKEAPANQESDSSGNNDTSGDSSDDKEKSLEEKTYDEMSSDDVIQFERLSQPAPESQSGKVYELAGYQFEVPSSIDKKAGEDDARMVFKIKDKNGESTSVVIMVASRDNISYDNRENDMNSLADDFSIINEEKTDETLSGNNAYLLNGRYKLKDDGKMVYSTNSTKDHFIAGDAMIALIYPEGGKDIIICMLLEPLRTEYDYKNEFMKLCDSFTKTGGTGVSDDFKAMMDAYEEFIDEYIAFMNKYNQNPSDMELMSEYFDFMTKYAEYADKIAKLEDSEMTDEEAAYYLEVTTRVANKLAQASLSY